MSNLDSSTKTPFYGEREISNAKLICFENPNKKRTYEISIKLPEFTCLCPFSGYPDFAEIRLRYQPMDKVIELKALKLYINSYRNQQISHEEVANRILDDLVEACQPLWISLDADFHPRGNVHTIVSVNYGKKQLL